MHGNPLTLGPIAGAKDSLRLTPEQRSMHLHITGNTGSGKSKFLEHLIRQDILAHRRSKCGLVCIDLHGNLHDSLLAWMALKGIDRPVVPIDPHRGHWIVAYNLLRKRRSASASVVVSAIVDAMAHVWGAADTRDTPRFARWARNILYALYVKNLTLAEAVHLLSEQVEVREAMTRNLSDGMVQRDWDMVRSWKRREFEDEVSSTVNRLVPFLSNIEIAAMIGQSDRSFDFGRAIEEGQIVLVNLSQAGGIIHQEDARLIGTLLLNDLWTAATERGKRDGLKPFYAYVDEFQEFLTPTLAKNLDQSRGFGIHWTLSHQFPAQLRDDGDNGCRIYNSVMENARNKVVFSLATEENMRPMAQWLFTGVMNPDEVKHALHSPTVVRYREEYRRTYSRGVTTSEGGTHHSSSSSGQASGGSASEQFETDTWSDSSVTSEGHTDSWSQSATKGTSDVPMLIPEIEPVLSSIQYRSLEEQLFRAMAVLFDQEQRQGVARLVGMRAPVSIITPFVEPNYIRQERVETFTHRLYQKLPFAIAGPVARAQVEARRRDFPTMLLTAVETVDESDEPVTTKRRIR
jgi:Type IV secretion-system coupling protein DNA-binding domain